MDSRWVKGLSGEKKEARKKEVLGYKNAFDDLRELLKDLEEEGKNPPDYSSPSWAYQQADQNGANRMLRKILKLIQL